MLIKEKYIGVQFLVSHLDSLFQLVCILIFMLLIACNNNELIILKLSSLPHFRTLLIHVSQIFK